MRTVVLQVENCEVAALVGYRVGSGEPTDTVLRKSASRSKSQAREALRDLLTKQALGALTFSIDGKRLVPTAVRAKLSIEPGQSQPAVVVLVTFGMPAGKQLAVSTSEPRSTRFSWTDRSDGRVQISDAPSQGKWYPAVASFLLSMSPNSGGSACAAPSKPSP